MIKKFLSLFDSLQESLNHEGTNVQVSRHGFAIGYLWRIVSIDNIWKEENSGFFIAVCDLNQFYDVKLSLSEFMSCSAGNRHLIVNYCVDERKAQVTQCRHPIILIDIGNARWWSSLLYCKTKT